MRRQGVGRYPLHESVVCEVVRFQNDLTATNDRTNKRTVGRTRLTRQKEALECLAFYEEKRKRRDMMTTTSKTQKPGFAGLGEQTESKRQTSKTKKRMGGEQHATQTAAQSDRRREDNKRGRQCAAWVAPKQSRVSTNTYVDTQL